MIHGAGNWGVKPDEVHKLDGSSVLFVSDAVFFFLKGSMC